MWPARTDTARALGVRVSPVSLVPTVPPRQRNQRCESQTSGFLPGRKFQVFCKIFHLKRSQGYKSSHSQGRQAGLSLGQGNNTRKKDLFYFFPSKPEQGGRKPRVSHEQPPYHCSCRNRGRPTSCGESGSRGWLRSGLCHPLEGWWVGRVAAVASGPTPAPSTPRTNNSHLPAQPCSLSCFLSAGLSVGGSAKPRGPPSQWHRGGGNRRCRRGTATPGGFRHSWMPARSRARRVCCHRDAGCDHQAEGGGLGGSQHPPSRWVASNASKFVFLFCRP